MLLILTDLPEDGGVLFANDFDLRLQAPALIQLSKDKSFPSLPVAHQSGIGFLLVLSSDAGMFAGEALPYSADAGFQACGPLAVFILPAVLLISNKLAALFPVLLSHHPAALFKRLQSAAFLFSGFIDMPPEGFPQVGAGIELEPLFHRTRRELGLSSRRNQ